MLFDLTLTVLLTLTAGIGILLVGIIYLRRAMNPQHIEELMDNYVRTWLTNEEKVKELVKLGDLFIDRSMNKIYGAVGGSTSGLSKQMKGLESDLIGGAVDQWIPGAGDLAVGIVRKYPLVKALIPYLLKGKGIKGTQSTSETEF